MKLRVYCLPALAVAAGLVAGCDSAPSDSTASSAPAAGSTNSLRTFEVKGVVKELNPAGRSARIKHEEIPGYMVAMTMNLKVRDAAELEGLAPEDAITFRLNVTDDEHWIDQVRKLAPVTPDPVEEAGTPLTNPSRWRLVRDVEPLDVGDPMTDYTFTNQLGQAVRLADLKGQAYAFTFIFTRCPLPEFCPLMSSNLKAVQEALSERADAPDNWRLFSITIDPEFDTPLVLNSYARRYGHDPERWSFLTAPLIDITAICEQFGLEFYRPDGTINHKLRTVVVDAAGRVQNILLGNTWKPEEVVEYLVAAARVEGTAASNDPR